MVPFVDLRAQYRELAIQMEEAFASVCLQGDFILGPALRRFEQQFAAYVGTSYCVGVGNGTEALSLAYRALGIGAGDEVIVPAHTFVASAFAVCHCGAKPVFADIDPKTYLLDLKSAENALSPRTKAICPVHLYGRASDMDEILNFARRHNLRIVEDAAQAHGARWRGRRVGSLGDAGAFSFYPAKNLGAYGDGGAVVTGNKEIADRLVSLRNYGSPEKYRHDEIGFNSRLDSLQAEILSIKLAFLDQWNARRISAAAFYKQRLQERGLMRVLAAGGAEPEEHVYHLFVIEVPDREALRDKMLKNGVQTVVHYPLPLHLQPAYADLGYRAGDFPNAERAAARVLSLPLYPEIEQDQITEVVDVLSDALSSAGCALEK